jgi:hypothetical protein
MEDNIKKNFKATGSDYVDWIQEYGARDLDSCEHANDRSAYVIGRVLEL